MFKKKPYDLDEAVATALAIVTNADATEAELEYATRIIQAVSEIRRTDERKEIDPNTVLTTSASLLSFAAVLKHEWAHVITGKAFSLIRRF